jgi:hypothetical protein
LLEFSTVAGLAGVLEVPGIETDEKEMVVEDVD